jgi:hypothetical protein
MQGRSRKCMHFRPKIVCDVLPTLLGRWKIREQEKFWDFSGLARLTWLPIPCIQYFCSFGRKSSVSEVIVNRPNPGWSETLWILIHPSSVRMQLSQTCSGWQVWSLYTIVGWRCWSPMHTVFADREIARVRTKDESMLEHRSKSPINHRTNEEWMDGWMYEFMHEWMEASRQLTAREGFIHHAKQLHTSRNNPASQTVSNHLPPVLLTWFVSRVSRFEPKRDSRHVTSW